MCFLNRFLIIALLFLELVDIVPETHIVSYLSLRLCAGLVALLNAAIRPLFLLFSFPLSFKVLVPVSLGMNALLFWIIKETPYGMDMTSFQAYGICVLLISAASAFINKHIYIKRDSFK